MQRREFTRSLTAVGASLALSRPLWAGPNDPLDARQALIGCSLSLTGPVASRSQELRQGLEAGVNWVNSKGGVHGRELRLQALDDGYEAERATTNVRQLISDNNVAALISCTGTANNQSILPLVEQAQIPYIAPQSGAVSLRKADHRSVFHVRASYAEEARQMTQKLVDMGLTDLVIVYQNNTFGREIAPSMQAAVKSLNEGTAVALRQVVLQEGETAVGLAADQAMNPRPQAVILATAGDITVDLITSLRKISRKTPLATTSVALSGTNLRQLGDQAAGLALTMVVPDANHTSVVLTRDYQRAMRAAGHSEFPAISYEGYVNVRVLAEGLERAGKDLTRARLRTAIASIRGLDLGGLTVDYGANAPYVGSKYVRLGVLGPNGRFVG
jgi:ABC-type branched-subunit amino acid transport system substrate-binding protein